MSNEKHEIINQILSDNLQQDELEALAQDWKAFYENPGGYSESPVVEMVKQWLQDYRKQKDGQTITDNDLLLVIDMQNVYSKGQPWECYGCQEATTNIERVVSSGEFADRVVFTKFLAPRHPVGCWKEYNKAYADINSNPWMSELMSPFDTLANKYTIVNKCTFSSVHDPIMFNLVREYKRVFVTGVVAECCVLSTVMSLIDMGIKVMWATDCIAGYTGLKEKTEDILSGLSPIHVEFCELAGSNGMIVPELTLNKTEKEYSKPKKILLV